MCLFNVVISKHKRVLTSRKIILNYFTRQSHLAQIKKQNEISAFLFAYEDRTHTKLSFVRGFGESELRAKP